MRKYSIRIVLTIIFVLVAVLTLTLFARKYQTVRLKEIKDQEEGEEMQRSLAERAAVFQNTMDEWLEKGPFTVELLEVPQEAVHIINDLVINDLADKRPDKEQVLLRAQQIFAFLVKLGQEYPLQKFLQQEGCVVLDCSFDPRFSVSPIFRLVWDGLNGFPAIFYSVSVGSAHSITFEEISEGSDERLLGALSGLGTPEEILERFKDKSRYYSPLY